MSEGAVRVGARACEQRPDLDAGAEQVGEALRALEAEESEAAAAAAPAAAADECASGAASLGASLACVGCGVQPWQVGRRSSSIRVLYVFGGERSVDNRFVRGVGRGGI